jgi:hypothetical protein
MNYGYQRSDISDQEPGSLGWWFLETFYIEMGWGGGKRGKKRLTTEIAEEPQSSQRREKQE